LHDLPTPEAFQPVDNFKLDADKEGVKVYVF
jgi:hypothetical protein